MSITRRSSIPLLCAAAAVCCSLPSGIAHAQAVQPLDTIRATAENHLRTQLPASATARDTRIIVTAGHLDPRLRLSPCAGNLAASRPAGSNLGARNTVAVSCKQGADWTIYVPVMLESETPVLVIRRPVARGATLTAEDTELQRQRVPGLATHYVTDTAELAGRHARRALQAGTLLTADALATNLLVRRGQQVTLLAAVGGIEVRAVGKALADGAAADRIRVQNLHSARIVEGFVESADIVRITP